MGPKTVSARQPDVLVVGGGPAGSVSAGLLASQGWNVLLVDRARFPRPKPCGECLNPGAVEALRRLGLLETVLALQPARLGGWVIRSTRGERVVGRFGRGIEGGLGLRRLDMDAALLGVARQRGATVRTGLRVVDVSPGGGRVEVRARESGRDGLRTWRPRLVIGADGLRSVVARSVGAVRRRPRLRKVSLTCHVRASPRPADHGTLLLSDEGTVGLAPLDGSGRIWNATVVVDPAGFGRALAADPMAVFRERIASAGAPWAEAEVVDGPWTSGPFDWPCRSVTGPGVLLVGDAAGYYDPLTGQGIYRALRSAEWAAEAADAHLAGRPGALATYRDRMRAFVPGRRLQHGVERVMSRRWLREPALRLLARRPAVADRLIRVTGDVEPVGSLVSPGRLLKRYSGPRAGVLRGTDKERGGGDAEHR
jgi:2-polyprenyl-6-methoxyphenol hydroxylase-like FAD-dependent oxidoreductase